MVSANVERNNYIQERTFNMLRAFIVIFMLISVSACNAPRNYDECVLKEMKGQSKEMVIHARDLCEFKFPFEKKLYGYEDNIDFSWRSESESIHVQIKKNYGEYQITRYKASFSEKVCQKSMAYNNPEDFTLTKTFEFADGSKSASVYVGSGAKQYKCMRTNDIFGIHKR